MFYDHEANHDFRTQMARSTCVPTYPLGPFGRTICPSSDLVTLTTR